MFEPLPSQFSFPEAEKRILAFWEAHNIFQKSLEQRQGATRFVFYEGPPTANGLPHPGHCLTRAIKDLFPRYQTMCGRLVERKAGWDTHGLPVEVEVCKELGIHTKQEIEAYGVEKFVRKCIESVFRYTREWEQMTRRLGFWVNLEEAYVTYQQSYVESVWWSLKTLFDRGLLYQGHKVVWWWAQGGTALSAGEVGEGYRTVKDPSVYIRFPLVETGSIGVPPVRVAETRRNTVGPELTKRRRILPHWEAGGSTYFMSFRLQVGELSPAERTLVLDACRNFDGERYLLHATVVMPDHVHLLWSPLERSPGDWWSIADLMHSIKGFTAKAINTARGTTGVVWQREYYDRIIRDHSDFDEKWNYVVQNPMRRGLPETYEWVWVEPTHGSHRRDADAPHPKVSLLVWTTTPWTLISNHFAAVGPDVDYSLVHDTTSDEYFYIATALVNPTAEKAKHKLETVATCKGRDLVGLRYTPPFDCYAATIASQTAKLKDGGETPSPSQGEGRGEGQGVDFVAWRILPADFIDLETGTGIVHIAPAYGEVDFNLLQDERQRFVDELNSIPLINAVAPDGTFTDEAPPAYRGRWVKDCDKEIMQELKARGVLLHQETIEHEYPFCPRAEDDPLIQYARKSWFVRTSQFKDEFLANNDKINWLPEHIQEGRFGDFLRNNVDWALSRERYWGTPLPIWVCEQTGKMEAIGSLAELTAKPGATDATPEYPQGMWAAKKAEDPTIPDHLRVHKPYIDAWVYDSPFAAGAKMRRVPEVIDCWWDAGSMPFAQWGFPHAPHSFKTFGDRFPADFISEAIDQTRGWFYGLLAISTLLFSDATMKDEFEAMRRLRASLDLGSGELTAEKVAAVMKHVASSPIQRAFASPGLPEPPQGEEARKLYAEVAWSLNEMRAAGFPVPPAREGCTVETSVITGNYPMPYRTCIVLGHVMGEDGLKMSKRTKNYKEPGYIFDSYGADAMRWFFFSAQPPWTSVRFQEANIRDAQREFLVRLYNVFSFFNIYANIDGFDAEGTGNGEQGTGRRAVPQRSELDRWIISELNRTVRDVRTAMDRFENFPAAGRIRDFVDALSNWYVRRSRERFWRGIEGSRDQGIKASAPISPADQEKWDAYNTLYECLLTLSELIAPFTPFFAETMYQNLTGQATGASDSQSESAPKASSLNPEPRTLNPLSVHLCDYPHADEALIDESLAQEMDLVRDIVSLGRAARTAAKLKVRQPLALAEIILTRREHAGWLETHSALIAEELNLKSVELASDAEQYVTYQVKADFKAIGPKFGKLAPQIAAALAKLEPAAARKTLTETGRLTIDLAGGPVTLTEQEVEIRLEAKPGWSAAQGRGGVVVVKTGLTDELRDEGLVRELIHQVQALRKVQDLPYEARVRLYAQADERVLDVLRRFAHVVESECLAATINFEMSPAGAEVWTGKVEGHAATLGIVRV